MKPSLYVCVCVHSSQVKTMTDFNPFMPRVSLMTHEEIDENQIVKRIERSFRNFY